MNYDTLVLSGGSIKGVCHIGALDYLADENKIKNIKNYVGTSVGSIIGYLLIIDYTPLEILLSFCHNNPFNETNINILSMLSNKGALSFSPITDLLEKLTINKIGVLMTMKRLYEIFGKRLVCVTYNLSLAKIECIDYMTDPDMPCLTAIRMSCNLPLIFEKFKYNSYQYIDGGIANNFPLTIGESIGKSVIAIALDTEQNKEQDSIIEFFFEILNVPLRNVLRETIKNAKPESTVIYVEVNDTPFFDFAPKISKILRLFKLGYQSAKKIKLSL